VAVNFSLILFLETKYDPNWTRDAPDSLSSVGPETGGTLEYVGGDSIAIVIASAFDGTFLVATHLRGALGTNVAVQTILAAPR